MKLFFIKPWSTKDAMAWIYENNLWGGDKSEFHLGLGSHHPETVNPYIAVVSAFLKEFETPPVIKPVALFPINYSLPASTLP